MWVDFHTYRQHSGPLRPGAEWDELDKPYL